jgi:hypothetical protein
MDNWQAWAAAIFGFILSLLAANNKREKDKAEKMQTDFNQHRLEVMERITKVESEIMTEREVREILHEFFQPFQASLNKIDVKTDAIGKDITELRVDMASTRKRAGDK